MGDGKSESVAIHEVPVSQTLEGRIVREPINGPSMSQKMPTRLLCMCGGHTLGEWYGNGCSQILASTRKHTLRSVAASAPEHLATCFLTLTSAREHPFTKHLPNVKPLWVANNPKTVKSVRLVVFIW